MFKEISISLVLFSSMASGVCPDLSGKFLCDYSSSTNEELRKKGSKFEVQVTFHAPNIYSYSYSSIDPQEEMSSIDIVADGQSKYDPNENMYQIFSCSDESLISSHYDENGDLTGKVYQNLSKNGNYQVSGFDKIPYLICKAL